MDTPPPLASSPPPLPVDESSVRYAGFWLRLAASIIDAILIVIISWPILLSIYGVEYFNSEKLVKGPADFLVSWVLPALLAIVLWVRYRGTPGKLLLGLRVIDARTGGKLDFLQAVIRYFGYFVSALPLCFGFLWIAFDSRKQSFHDKLARTLVIRAK